MTSVAANITKNTTVTINTESKLKVKRKRKATTIPSEEDDNSFATFTGNIANSSIIPKPPYFESPETNGQRDQHYEQNKNDEPDQQQQLIHPHTPTTNLLNDFASSSLSPSLPSSKTTPKTTTATTININTKKKVKKRRRKSVIPRSLRKPVKSTYRNVVKLSPPPLQPQPQRYIVSADDEEEDDKRKHDDNDDDDDDDGIKSVVSSTVTRKIDISNCISTPVLTPRKRRRKKKTGSAVKHTLNNVNEKVKTKAKIVSSKNTKNVTITIPKKNIDRNHDKDSFYKKEKEIINEFSKVAKSPEKIGSNTVVADAPVSPVCLSQTNEEDESQSKNDAQNRVLDDMCNNDSGEHSNSSFNKILLPDISWQNATVLEALFHSTSTEIATSPEVGNPTTTSNNSVSTRKVCAKEAAAEAIAESFCSRTSIGIEKTTSTPYVAALYSNPNYSDKLTNTINKNHLIRNVAATNSTKICINATASNQTAIEMEAAVRVIAASLQKTTTTCDELKSISRASSTATTETSNKIGDLMNDEKITHREVFLTNTSNSEYDNNKVTVIEDAEELTSNINETKTRSLINQATQSLAATSNININTNKSNDSDIEKVGTPTIDFIGAANDCVTNQASSSSTVASDTNKKVTKTFISEPIIQPTLLSKNAYDDYGDGSISNIDTRGNECGSLTFGSHENVNDKGEVSFLKKDVNNGNISDNISEIDTSDKGCESSSFDAEKNYNIVEKLSFSTPSEIVRTLSPPPPVQNEENDGNDCYKSNINNSSVRSLPKSTHNKEQTNVVLHYSRNNSDNRLSIQVSPSKHFIPIENDATNISNTTTNTLFHSLTSIPDEAVTTERIIEDKESDSWTTVNYTNADMPFNQNPAKLVVARAPLLYDPQERANSIHGAPSRDYHENHMCDQECNIVNHSNLRTRLQTSSPVYSDLSSETPPSSQALEMTPRINKELHLKCHKPFISENLEESNKVLKSKISVRKGAVVKSLMDLAILQDRQVIQIEQNKGNNSASDPVDGNIKKMVHDTITDKNHDAEEETDSSSIEEQETTTMIRSTPLPRNKTNDVVQNNDLVHHSNHKEMNFSMQTPAILIDKQVIQNKQNVVNSSTSNPIDCGTKKMDLNLILEANQEAVEKKKNEIVREKETKGIISSVSTDVVGKVIDVIRDSNHHEISDSMQSPLTSADEISDSSTNSIVEQSRPIVQNAQITQSKNKIITTVNSNFNCETKKVDDKALLVKVNMEAVTRNSNSSEDNREMDVTRQDDNKRNKGSEIIPKKKTVVTNERQLALQNNSFNQIMNDDAIVIDFDHRKRDMLPIKQSFAATINKNTDNYIKQAMPNEKTLNSNEKSRTSHTSTSTITSNYDSPITSMLKSPMVQTPPSQRNLLLSPLSLSPLHDKKQQQGNDDGKITFPELGFTLKPSTIDQSQSLVQNSFVDKATSKFDGVLKVLVNEGTMSRIQPTSQMVGECNDGRTKNTFSNKILVENNNASRINKELSIVSNRRGPISPVLKTSTVQTSPSTVSLLPPFPQELKDQQQQKLKPKPQQYNLISNESTTTSESNEQKFANNGNDLIEELAPACKNGDHTEILLQISQSHLKSSPLVRESQKQSKEPLPSPQEEQAIGQRRKGRRKRLIPRSLRKQHHTEHENYDNGNSMGYTSASSVSYRSDVSSTKKKRRGYLVISDDDHNEEDDIVSDVIDDKEDSAFEIRKPKKLSNKSQKKGKKKDKKAKIQVSINPSRNEKQYRLKIQHPCPPTPPKRNGVTVLHTKVSDTDQQIQPVLNQDSLLNLSLSKNDKINEHKNDIDFGSDSKSYRIQRRSSSSRPATKLIVSPSSQTSPERQNEIHGEDQSQNRRQQAGIFLPSPPELPNNSMPNTPNASSNQIENYEIIQAMLKPRRSIKGQKGGVAYHSREREQEFYNGELVHLLQQYKELDDRMQDIISILGKDDNSFNFVSSAHLSQDQQQSANILPQSLLDKPMKIIQKMHRDRSESDKILKAISKLRRTSMAEGGGTVHKSKEREQAFYREELAHLVHDREELDDRIREIIFILKSSISVVPSRVSTLDHKTDDNRKDNHCESSLAEKEDIHDSILINTPLFNLKKGHSQRRLGKSSRSSSSLSSNKEKLCSFNGKQQYTLARTPLKTKNKKSSIEFDATNMSDSDMTSLSSSSTPNFSPYITKEALSPSNEERYQQEQLLPTPILNSNTIHRQMSDSKSSSLSFSANKEKLCLSKKKQNKKLLMASMKKKKRTSIAKKSTTAKHFIKKKKICIKNNNSTTSKRKQLKQQQTQKVTSSVTTTVKSKKAKRCTGKKRLPWKICGECTGCRRPPCGDCQVCCFGRRNSNDKCILQKCISLLPPDNDQQKKHNRVKNKKHEKDSDENTTAKLNHINGSIKVKKGHGKNIFNNNSFTIPQLSHNKNVNILVADGDSNAVITPVVADKLPPNLEILAKKQKMKQQRGQPSHDFNISNNYNLQSNHVPCSSKGIVEDEDICSLSDNGDKANDVSDIDDDCVSSINNNTLLAELTEEDNNETESYVSIKNRHNGNIKDNVNSSNLIAGKSVSLGLDRNVDTSPKSRNIEKHIKPLTDFSGSQITSTTKLIENKNLQKMRNDVINTLSDSTNNQSVENNISDGSTISSSIYEKSQNSGSSDSSTKPKIDSIPNKFEEPRNEVMSNSIAKNTTKCSAVNSTKPPNGATNAADFARRLRKMERNRFRTTLCGSRDSSDGDDEDSDEESISLSSG